MPATPEDLLARLDRLGIETVTHRHPPVHTVEEAERICGDLPGGHCKNLLLRDHKKVMWLVVALARRKIDLKALRDAIGSGRLSFASPDRLLETLGVEPGGVTPFGLINDTGAAVRVVLDAEMMEIDPLNFHPLTNAASTAIRPADLLAFIRSCGHEPRVVGL